MLSRAKAKVLNGELSSETAPTPRKRDRRVFAFPMLLVLAAVLFVTVVGVLVAPAAAFLSDHGLLFKIGGGRGGGEAEHDARRTLFRATSLNGPPVPRSVVIAGIVRDDISSLPGMILRIEEMGAAFEDYRVLIVENDSCDGTVALLRGWAKRNPRVFADTRKLGSRTKRPSHGFLAQARNRYLDLLFPPPTAATTTGAGAAFQAQADSDAGGSTSAGGSASRGNSFRVTDHKGRETGGSFLDFEGCDLVLVVDMDLQAVDVEGLRLSVSTWLELSSPSSPSSSPSSAALSAVSSKEEGQQQGQPPSLSFPPEAKWWGGIAANGVTQNGRYFDVFALRVRPSLVWPPSNGVLFETPTGRALIRKHQALHDPFSAPPFGVDSAFGGLAVYHRHAVANCRYDSGPFDDCEHVAFHACVAAHQQQPKRREEEATTEKEKEKEKEKVEHSPPADAKEAKATAKATATATAKSPPPLSFYLGVAPRLVVGYSLPCDPGPGVEMEAGCLRDGGKAAGEIQAFEAKRARLAERPPRSGVPTYR